MSLIGSSIRRLTGRFGGAQRTREAKAERERERVQRREDLLARRAAATAAKRQAEEERAARKESERARLELERRARDTIAAKAFDDYLEVRDHARRMREWSGGTVGYTEAEQRTIDALEPLWNATSETIASLRLACEVVSDVRARDYQSASSDLMTTLKRELAMLRRQVGSDLFVQESRALGGFGFERHGELYNADTLRFFKALIALQDGAVLQPCRATSVRRVVWEIGGGWGGLAYQFKTVCPNVTYLITGVPDAFLVSAVYLKAVFPDARCRFVTEPSRLSESWEDVDFVFAPEHAVPLLQPRLDLTLDMTSLGNISVDRMRLHVHRAFELGCPYFFSVMPPRSAAEQQTVWSVIEERYWPHPIPARRDQWAPAVLGVAPELRPDTEEAYLAGWRRIRV